MISSFFGVRDQNQQIVAPWYVQTCSIFTLLWKQCKFDPRSFYLSPSFCFSLLQVLYNELLSDKRPGVRGLEKILAKHSMSCHDVSNFWCGWPMWLLSFFPAGCTLWYGELHCEAKRFFFLTRVFRWLLWISPNLVGLLEAWTAPQLSTTERKRLGNPSILEKMQLSSDMEVDFTSWFHVILLEENFRMM